MQLQGATELELRISQCMARCESELPASELETTIVSCLSDAVNELQRLRKIIKFTHNHLTDGLQSYPRTVKGPTEEIMIASM